MWADKLLLRGEEASCAPEFRERTDEHMDVAEIVAGALGTRRTLGTWLLQLTKGTRAGMTSVVHPVDTVDGGQRAAADTGMEGERAVDGAVIDG